MPVSDAKKASNAKWDAANMAYQTVKVNKTLLEEFKELCAANGDKVNTVLREAMEEYVKKGRGQSGNMILDLRAKGWSDTEITNYILWIETGEEQYKPNEVKE